MPTDNDDDDRKSYKEQVEDCKYRCMEAERAKSFSLYDEDSDEDSSDQLDVNDEERALQEERIEKEYNELMALDIAKTEFVDAIEEFEEYFNIIYKDDDSSPSPNTSNQDFVSADDDTTQDEDLEMISSFGDLKVTPENDADESRLRDSSGEDDDTSYEVQSPDRTSPSENEQRTDQSMLNWHDSHPRALPLSKKQQVKSNLKADVLTFLRGKGPFNSKYAKVIDPKPGHQYAFENVSQKDLLHLAKRDLYEWRNFSVNKDVLEGMSRQQFNAATPIPQVTTNAFKKIVYYLPSRKRAHVRYDGDEQYGLLNDNMADLASPHELPKGEKQYPPPSLVSGKPANLAKYKEFYAQERTPKSTETPISHDSPTIQQAQNISITDEEDNEQAVRPVANTNIIVDATPLHKDNELQDFIWTPNNVKGLKEEMELRYRNATKEERQNLWQDVTTTHIGYAQGGDVYYRDYSNLQTDVYNHERADGYNWILRPKRFRAQNDLITTVSTYKNPDGSPNLNFQRYQYFFLADKKLITHYVGNHEVAVGRPHGNASKSTHDFLPSSGSVLDTLASQSRRTSPAEVYNKLTASAPGGILSKIVLPRNKKQIYNVRNSQTTKMMKDLQITTQIVDRELGGNVVRKIDSFHENANYIVAIDSGVQQLFDEFGRRRETNETVIFQYDTSFHAGGVGSQSLVSHLVVEFDEVVTPAQGEAPETSSTLILSTMVHQLKTMETHQEHLLSANLAHKFNLLKCRSVFVSDKEFENLPLWNGCRHVLCWNHIKSDIKFNAKRYNYT